MGTEQLEKIKKLRRNVLELLYDKRNRTPEIFVQLNELTEKLDPNITAEELCGEIRYLYEKGLIKYPGNVDTYGEPSFTRISEQGIDLIEDPESFNKLFSVNVVTINGDRNTVATDHSNISDIHTTDPEIKELIKELQVSVDNKKPDKIKQIFG